MVSGRSDVAKEKIKVVVRLMGHDYTMVTDQDPAQVQRMAQYVDRKMRELAIVARAQEGVVPILTCITLAEELFRSQDENNRLLRELAALTDAKDINGQDAKQ